MVRAPANGRPSTAISNDSTCGDVQRCGLTEFEVTIVTVRSGTTAVVVAASDRESALSTVQDELARGDLIAPPEHCTDDIHTEIWTIRDLH